MALTANKITVAMFGVAAGGYKSLIEEYATAYGWTATVAALLPVSGLNPSFFGQPIYNNQQFAEALVAKMMPGLSSTVASATATIISNYMAANPTLSRADVVVALIEALDAVPSTDPVYGGVAASFDSKVALADAYTGNSTDLNELAQVVGNTPQQNVGETFTLTTNADSGSSFTGTSGNDTFVGVIGSDGLTANGTTFNPGDNLDGGAGTDTLQISISGTHTNDLTTSSFVLKNIEKVLVTNFETSTNDDTIDMGGATGITTLGLANSSATGDTIFTNVANIVDAEMRGGGDLTIEYVSTLLTGSDDAVKLTLNGVGTSTAQPTFTTWNGAATGVAETLNIVSQTAANYLKISGNNDHKTINITGDKNLTISNALDTTVTKVDASAFTGALSVEAGASEITILGGSGNDVIKMAGTLSSQDSIDGGAGTDTLALNATDAGALTAAIASRISNVEVLRADAGSATYNASLISGITKVVANHNDSNTVIFSNMGANTELQITATLQGDNDNVTATLASNTTNDSIKVTIGATSSTSGTGAAAGTLTLDNYETITIKSTGGTTAADNSIAAVTSTSATKIVVEGDRKLTLTAFTGSGSGLKTLDASAFTADLNMNATLTGTNITVTGGSGNDTLKGGSGNDSIAGGAGNDDIDVSAGGKNTVDGGAGNDSITGGAGNDVISGGDGNDTIVGAAGNDSLAGGAGDDVFVINTWSDITAADTIDGGEGNDTISTTDTNVTLNSTATSGISNVERLLLANTSSAQTVTITDAGIGAFNNDIRIAAITTGTQSHVVNAAGVLSSTSKVTFAGAGGAETYYVGNGIDNVDLGAGNDTVTISTVAYLSGNDTLKGGAGTGDTLAFTEQVTSSTTITATQLSNVSGFETFSFDTNSTSAGTGNYVLTLTDTILAANNNAGKLTVSRGSQTSHPDTGTLKIDGSAVTAAYTLELSGASGNDTLIGGAGNDTIDGGGGADSLTGGAGNDVFVFEANQTSNGTDTITDFDFGTSSTSVDKLDFSAAFTATAIQGVFLRSAGQITSGTGANVEVLIMDTATYADTTAAETAVQGAFSGAQSNNATEVIVFWQDSIGNLRVSTYSDTTSNSTSDGTLTDAWAILSGLTITGVKTLIDAGDFIL